MAAGGRRAALAVRPAPPQPFLRLGRSSAIGSLGLHTLHFDSSGVQCVNYDKIMAAHA